MARHLFFGGFRYFKKWLHVHGSYSYFIAREMIKVVSQRHHSPRQLITRGESISEQIVSPLLLWTQLSCTHLELGRSSKQSLQVYIAKSCIVKLQVYFAITSFDTESSLISFGPHTFHKSI